MREWFLSVFLFVLSRIHLGISRLLRFLMLQMGGVVLFSVVPWVFEEIYPPRCWLDANCLICPTQAPEGTVSFYLRWLVLLLYRMILIIGPTPLELVSMCSLWWGGVSWIYMYNGGVINKSIPYQIQIFLLDTAFEHHSMYSVLEAFHKWHANYFPYMSGAAPLPCLRPWGVGFSAISYSYLHKLVPISQKMFWLNAPCSELW